MASRFWFSCTVCATCPLCLELSTELLLCSAPTCDTEWVRKQLREQAYQCEKCHRPFPAATDIFIEVYPQAWSSKTA